MKSQSTCEHCPINPSLTGSESEDVTILLYFGQTKGKATEFTCRDSSRRHEEWTIERKLAPKAAWVDEMKQTIRNSDMNARYVL